MKGHFMKLHHLIVLFSLSLSACTAHISGSSDAPPPTPAPIASPDVAKGSVHGKAFQAADATYRRTKDSKGKALITVSLGAKNTASCDILPTTDSAALFLTLPATVGTYAFPDATAVFSYIDGGQNQNDISSDGSIALISDDGTTIKGSVVASYDGSSVNGTFTARSCDTPATPAPTSVTTPTGPDAQVALQSYMHYWHGETNVTSPGKYGDVGATVSTTATSTQGRKAFQLNVTCAFSADGAGNGLQSTSDENGGHLEVDSTGTVYQVCPYTNTAAIGSLSSSQLSVRLPECMVSDSQVLPSTAIVLVLTDATHGHITLDFSSGAHCSGDVKLSDMD
jgi:hypothetical protein